MTIVFTASSFLFAETGNGKSYGIAVNPPMTMFRIVSGEFNIWNITRHGEINVPFLFTYKQDFIDYEDLDIYSIGTKYRHFMIEDQNGFFGEMGYGFYLANADNNHKVNTLSFGLGYRLIYDNGFFWGCSLSLGRAWVFDQQDFIIYDVDFFKVGYCW